MLGTAPRILITCTDDAGVVTDPAALSVIYRRDGATTPATYTLSDSQIVKVSTGLYRFTPPTPTVGTWRCHTVVTGAVNRGGLCHFTITPGL